MALKTLMPMYLSCNMVYTKVEQDNINNITELVKRQIEECLQRRIGEVTDLEVTDYLVPVYDISCRGDENDPLSYIVTYSCRVPIYLEGYYSYEIDKIDKVEKEIDVYTLDKRNIL